MADAESGRTGPPSLRDQAAWLITFLGLFWVIELANLLADRAFSTWGILPRTRIGLRGIPFSWLLHQSPEHLALNTVPLAVLGTLVLLRGTAEFLRVTLTVVLVAGVGVWALGRPSYHLGASGLVVGYFGYLVSRAFYRRSWRSLAVATITLLLYGGLLPSVLPNHPEVSWESHLAGLLAGVAATWLGEARSAPRCVQPPGAFSAPRRPAPRRRRRGGPPRRSRR